MGQHGRCWACSTRWALLCSWRCNMAACPGSGMLRWYATEGWRISGIWLYPAIVYLFVTPFMTRYIYKKTRNPYLCGIINAIIITMLCVANTTTVLGGGAVVAANY